MATYWLSSETPAQATERYVKHLISGKLIIAVAAIGGRVRDIWITNDPSVDLRHCPPDEAIVFRLWDGTLIPQRKA